MDPRTQIEYEERRKEQAFSAPTQRKSYKWLLSFPVGAAIIWGFSLIPAVTLAKTKSAPSRLPRSMFASNSRLLRRRCFRA